MLLISLSNDSIDMDEAQTWDYARLGTFSEFCTELASDKNSETQMPLGMFSFWGWSRVFGTGELAMRSHNLIWGAIVLAAFASIGGRISAPWLPMLFAIQPFAWYCMNHARTPLMQMAGGALLAAAATSILQKRLIGGRAIALLCVGSILLCGANMLGIIPLASLAVGLLVFQVWRGARIPLVARVAAWATLAALALLGLYYASTLLRGAGGAKIWSVSVANALFVIYEFLGFSGLGPGRQELRAILKGLAAKEGILVFLPGLILLAGAYATVLSAGYKAWLTRGERSRIEPCTRPALTELWLMGAGVALLSGLLLLTTASFAGFPFWGRHLAGAFPFWILALGITLHRAKSGLWRRQGRIAALLLIALLLISSLLIRFAPWHKHDDYRAAAAMAMQHSREGRSVWWVADHSGGNYYGLPLTRDFTDKPGEIQFAMNRTEPGAPDVVIISRPDNFDVPGMATRLLRSGSYLKNQQLQTFEVWERKDHP